MVRRKYHHRSCWIAIGNVGKWQEDSGRSIAVGRLKNNILAWPVRQLLLDFVSVMRPDDDQYALGGYEPLDPVQGGAQHRAVADDRRKLLEPAAAAEIL